MIEDKLVTDNKQIAQCLNEFFTNIGCQLAEQIPFQEFSDEYLPQNVDKSFKFPHITPEFVSKQIQEIPINKATGLDKISGKLLRYGEPEISGPLAFILNQPLKQGTFLTDWKNAIVVPIFKSGAVNDKNNYRPISILPVLSKVLERFVHMHFLTFPEENNLITLVQSGFSHVHSTLTSLINITDR